MTMRPGAQYALRLVSFGAPEIRQRYDRGVLIDPAGFPDWEFHARALVSLPADPPAELTIDELRVVDVLAANALMRWTGDDPLWPADDFRTPPGWTWAHTGRERRLALVPIELHAAWRHAGGISLLDATGERGLRVDYQPTRVAVSSARPVPPELLDQLDAALGYPLPSRYREFLAATDGAAPAIPGVLPGFGFIADQRLFGLARSDPAQDLLAANRYLADRFTADFLAIGYVQGGLLAVRVGGDDRDSIWWWDDDDPRADATDDAAVAARLLYRCADSIDDLWDRLAAASQPLLDLADAWVDAGAIAGLRPDGLGESLPASHRAPGQPPRVPDAVYFADPAIRLARLEEVGQ
jgi:A nuclease of the HNH/ENDO VII superfamily with conserved WHH